MSRRLGYVVLALYPLAFRRRYGQEMKALLEDTRVRPLTLVDLLSGALVAHVRPVTGDAATLDASDRLCATSAGVLACWVAFAAAGFGFYKTTEDPAFAAAGDAHGLLGASHLAVQVLAALASIAVVAGALPLAVTALAQARRDQRLRSVAALPVAAVAVFAGLTAVLVWIAHSQESERATTAGGVAFIAWGLAGLGCAAVVVAGARKALFAARIAGGPLAAAVVCGTVVTISMVAMASAVALYAVALASYAAGLGRAKTGPLALTTVNTALILQLAVMVIAGALATTATRRGRRASASRLSAKSQS